ncbi:MAG: hypothetical protein ACLFR1_06530, partial [Spirochaetia bacterium]
YSTRIWIQIGQGPKSLDDRAGVNILPHMDTNWSNAQFTRGPENPICFPHPRNPGNPVLRTQTIKNTGCRGFTGLGNRREITGGSFRLPLRCSRIYFAWKRGVSLENSFFFLSFHLRKLLLTI